MCVTGIGFELSLDGQILLHASQRACEGNIAHASHLGRNIHLFRESGGKELYSVAIDEHLPDIGIPTGVCSPVAEGTVGMQLYGTI